MDGHARCARGAKRSQKYICNAKKRLTLVKKNWIEIGISTGLVLAMTALILLVQAVFPAELKASGFAIVVLLFMVAMGLAGVKLADL
jgi:hypothetical protein